LPPIIKPVPVSKYAENLSAEEEILALGEDKTFGGAMLTTGLLLTDRALYYYGVDDPKASVRRGARKGFIPLHQIRKIEFKGNSSFEVNGLTSANSSMIPRYFEIRQPGRSVYEWAVRELIRPPTPTRPERAASAAAATVTGGSEPSRHSSRHLALD
jgi:hypothetical protein